MLGGGLLFIAVLSIWENAKQTALYDQQMAYRWGNNKGVTQVSCFYPTDQTFDSFYLLEIEHGIEEGLKEASIEAPKEGARLWVDGFSAKGKLTVKTEKASIDLNAYGVDGDFFSFHPIPLLSGSFFSKDSMMQDGIVLDEDAAWQLFGSNDIAGQQVMIGGVPHHVTGVVKREEGRFAKSAGLESSLCYVSLDSLIQYGSSVRDYCYEVVLPNPVKHFGKALIEKLVGKEGAVEVEIVENTGRFSLLRVASLLQNFGIRSMSRMGIVYPYWENIARAYEDVFVLIEFVKIVLWLMTLGIILWILCHELKGKQWNIKDKIKGIWKRRLG